MIILSLLLHLLLHLQNPSLSLSLSSDGIALLSLKSSVEQPPASSAFSDWNENDAYPCRWSGVSCMNVSGSGDPRVIGLDVSGKGLRGYIPSELGSLAFLRRLDLHDNELYGSIPTQLFNATSLYTVFLYGNNLSGPLPPSTFSLSRLQNLNLAGNSLSGALSPDLRNCKQLQQLILAGNNFSDEIPEGIWPEMENLVQLDLSSNEFTGPIPSDLNELKSLSGTLNLSFNHFSGEIPKSLGNLAVTVSLDLRNNNLSGEIPQTGSFSNQGPTAFLNNPNLCGFPLQKYCKDVDNQSSPGTQKSSAAKTGLGAGSIVLISAADAGSVALIGMVIVYLCWKKKEADGGCSCTGNDKLGGLEKGKLCLCITGLPKEDDSEMEDDNGISSSSPNRRGEGELVAMDKGFACELDELLRASAYVLGKSEMGIVYKVVVGNGVPVAVRRLGEGGEERYKEFVTEVQAIGRVKHPNVVKLRAYYWAPDEKLLICDFINNGSLASALRGRNGQPSASMTWSTRLKIAKGAARGIAYLHECSSRKLVHGDIKPSNILLDSTFNALISDFGLNRLFTITAASGGSLPYTTTSSKSSADRSYGYKAPEARIPGNRPTQKWDVYSFGVVLLELLTGKSPESSPPPPATSTSAVEVKDLVKWVRKGLEEEKPLSEMVDPMLIQEVNNKKQAMAVFHVALACSEGDPEIRPRMKNVSDNLVKIFI
ncbi:PREDICTED: receptor protein kinase-like protein ZAR1 [Tarenaya hassleriana]|uniref:receptor protein kinase-like protein ZAR1 n=1 Tax=Tarenaya hassleriana TaxID=28532 RepID=UPI00053C0BE6|nr:PREDICTED: receptor protein kinase-like protein ZAR1 [Tarenaya hassleriana]